MQVLGISIGELVIGIVSIVTAAFVSWEKIRQLKLEKAAGLLPNPERCEIHKQALLDVKTDLVAVRSTDVTQSIGIAEIRLELINIKENIKELRARHSV